MKTAAMNVDYVDHMIAWSAGVIEGEGCFVFSKDKRSNHHTAAVQVEMTDFDTIEKLQTIFGGTIVESNYPSKLKKNPNGKPSWRWKLVRQKEVFDCLLRIMPYLGERRLLKAKELFQYLEAKVVV